MGARFRSWWQKNKQHVLIVGIILIAVFTAFTLAVYKFGWDWTGFDPYIPPPKDSNFQRGKTLWDLLQLAGVIAIPIAVAWFTAQQNHDFQIAQEQRKTELEISTDNQREVLLRAYLDKMSDLLLGNHLRESHPDDEVRKIAEARTLTVLPRLDGKRKGNVLLFLYESGLIRRATRIIKLYGADLAEADLGGTDLSEADLSEANLSYADLSYASLSEADLIGANLKEARLGEAVLIGANLGKAVGTTTKQLLDEALSLKDAIMPDGSKHA